MKPLTDPFGLKPGDLESHAALDDDGNPWRPFDPDPPLAWTADLRLLLTSVTATLRAHPVRSLGLALAAGFLLGRVVAARSS